MPKTIHGCDWYEYEIWICFCCFIGKNIKQDKILDRALNRRTLSFFFIYKLEILIIYSSNILKNG